MVLLVLVLILGVYSLKTGNSKTRLVVSESLEEQVAVVNGQILTIADLAFYIAFVEAQVEEDALIYNPGNTREYWKIHANGTFITTEARKTAMDMAVHDELFFQLSEEAGLELDGSEEEYLANTQYDFWSDLSEEQKEALGVGQELLDASMRKIALAEKYQWMLSEMEDEEFEAYSYQGEAYHKLLETYDYEVNEEIWSRIPFGRVTVGLSQARRPGSRS